MEEIIRLVQAETTPQTPVKALRELAVLARGLAHFADTRGDQAEALESRLKVEATQEVCEVLAKALSLHLPNNFDPVETILLDIRRLQEKEQRYLTACDIAAKHCPVNSGESHIRDGIPRLAKKAAEEFERGRLEGRNEVYASEHSRGFSEGRKSLWEAIQATLLELQ
jgi:hypothetical protein